MHSIENKVSNSYVSPRLLKDRCWYSHGRMLAMIPEPTKNPKGSHFEINPDIWEAVMKKMFGQT
jgi:hypothetical protein